MKELERALLGDHQADERVAVLAVLRKADAHRALGLLFSILADDLIAAAWGSDDIAALLMAVYEQLHRVASRPEEDWWDIRAGAEMASPALHSLTSSEGTPAREAAAAVLEMLRVLGLSERG